ncbi:sodium:proton antiporter [Oceanobacillus sp. Castelsardo]|uniref:cation:proton antiporter n=1 Tax=Oceanobacillus sp. Castelsardo TaxID=1851204 RepID=UPI000AD71470|nr:sodium:proton antiporter [Oceanobacillus sp. Castelsardo]
MSIQEYALIAIVIIIVLGIFSQWLAWKIQWPSIVIMSIAGLLIGPVLGLFNPKDALGALYSPIISLAVAVILFEGSTSLDIRELKGISKSVFRVVTLGAFLAWIGGSLTAHYVANLSLEISFIIGGLFVVTGPTVIIPLLRQAKLKPRTAAVLKWEGIVVDPIGPLLALLAYEIIKITTNYSFHIIDLAPFFLAAIVAILLGIGIGLLISVLVDKGLFPEYLKTPIILSFVFICFTLAEVVMHETGMLAVTAMGITLGRTKKYVRSIGSIGHFVENVSVLLTSTIFILLTSSLTRETILEVFSWPIISFVLVMLFLVRPLSIFISTIGTELTMQEKTLIGWIAPRGIVALTVSGYFAELLVDDGYADASILTALTFALVFITVCVHGFSLGPIAKKLNLANTEPPGILIVGASSFAIAFADQLNKMGTPVLISDTSNDRLYQAKKLGITTFHGEILTEHSGYDLDLTPYEKIMAMTGDAAYNALVCQSFVPEFGYNHTFALVSNNEDSNVPVSLHSHILFGENDVFRELNRKVNIGFTIQAMNIPQKGSMKKNELKLNGTPLCIRRKSGEIDLITLREKINLEEDDQLIALIAP